MTDLKEHSEKAAFDAFADYVAKLMVKHGPKVLQLQRERVLQYMRLWEYIPRRSNVVKHQLLLGYRKKYEEFRAITKSFK